MCGIIAIVGNQPVAQRLVQGLQRLEYRGYDSAGIAVTKDEQIIRHRRAGRIVNLARALKEQPIDGHSGLGHTRWATHGEVNESNAHPHLADNCSLIHNGIIENYSSLKKRLLEQGVEFYSSTDSEVILRLFTSLRENKPLREAFIECLSQLQGAYAIAIMLVEDGETKLLLARNGAPLAIGYGENENYCGSDSIALAPLASRITHLHDGDLAIVTANDVELFDMSGQTIERDIDYTRPEETMVTKLNYSHFMEKEIFEQPETLAHCMSHYINLAEQIAKNEFVAGIDWKNVDQLVLTGCGTAYFSCMLGRRWFESLARIPTSCDIASELRFRDLAYSGNTMALAVSQSGETADTIMALNSLKQRLDGPHNGAGNSVVTAALVNVRNSSLSRAANHSFPIVAGPEIGVASTKAYTNSALSLFCLALAAAKARGHLTPQDEKRYSEKLSELPRLVSSILDDSPLIAEKARNLSHFRSAMFLGRGHNLATAFEGALKLKELSYIHAEAFPGGEMKHGPIAMIDENMPVIAVGPSDNMFDKIISAANQAASRGAKVLLITDARGAENAATKEFDKFIIPETDPLLNPILAVISLQLLAYHTARIMGKDVDQPRNLAKSVTVE